VGLSRVGGSPLNRDGIGRGTSGYCCKVSGGSPAESGWNRRTDGGEWRLAGGDEDAARLPVEESRRVTA
jgi:hypothetical protein